MDKENKKLTEASSEVDDVEWGETAQERILDRTPKHRSAQHRCKGRHCDTGFEKL